MTRARKLFGTDGVRGKAGRWPIVPDIITRLAISAGAQFRGSGGQQCIVIGKDTRLSGYMVEAALQAGFTAMGFKVYLLGPLPTPAVALLTKSMRADLGVMVSASHNAYADNGIKFFGPDGYKLSDAIEMCIEEGMEQDIPLAEPEMIGKAKRIDDAAGRYIEYAKSSLPKELRFDHLKIVVDCANGAAYKVAPSILWELGAEIIPIGNNPTGANINAGCGAMNIELARQTVLQEKADAAVILDGDADRIVMLDEKGEKLDGDKILALITQHFKNEQRLRSNVIVGTQMTNLGCERFIASQGLDFIRTPVGDRYVIEAMRKHHANVGGEQSGHIILHDYTTTGDGVIAALQILSIMQQSQKKLSELIGVFEAVPQVMVNLKLQDKIDLTHPPIADAIEKTRLSLGKDTYFLVRASGTEPLLRLMAQGEREDILEKALNDLGHTLQKLHKKS